MTIKINSLPTCSWCIRTKEFLKEHKVKFKDIDVGKDEKAADHMVEISGQRGTPVIEVNGKVIVGFDEKALRKELKIK